MITIYGASDDLVEVEGCEGADEFYVARVKDGEVCWRARLIAPSTEDDRWQQLCVRAIFDGCWHFAVGQVDESLPFPPWPVKVSQHQNGYSVLLTIDAPEGTRLDCTWPGEDR